MAATKRNAMLANEMLDPFALKLSPELWDKLHPAIVAALDRVEDYAVEWERHRWGRCPKCGSASFSYPADPENISAEKRCGNCGHQETPDNDPYEC